MMMQPEYVCALFSGWDETMIWSCLQGCMGKLTLGGSAATPAARITLGDFSFFAGEPDPDLIASAQTAILVPRDEAWAHRIEQVLKNRVKRAMRYATRKDVNHFQPASLQRMIQALPPELTLRRFTEDMFAQAKDLDWARDLLGQFSNYSDFAERGLAFGITDRGVLAAGAGAYSIYHGGLEIEIDTRPDYRRRGLASACGAALILACLELGIYPSWDAHDRRSLRLAEKLGYLPDKPYPVYLMEEAPFG